MNKILFINRKIKNVILSCNTLEQLESGKNFMQAGFHRILVLAALKKNIVIFWDAYVLMETLEDLYTAKRDLLMQRKKHE